VKRFWHPPPLSFPAAILFSLAGYVLIRIWFPLAPYFDTIPQLDIRSFSPSLMGGLGYGLLLLGLFWLFWRLFLFVWEGKRPLSPHLLFGITIIFGLILLNTYPINATDVYRYIIRGRVKSIHQQSQFELPPDAFPADPFAQYAGEWSSETTPYGPAWEMVATAVTTFSQDDLFLGLLLFKGIGLLNVLGVGYLIWRLNDKQAHGRRAAVTLLWCWNPAILLTFVVNGHNDVLMLLWLLIGVWFIRQKRLTVGFLFMVIAMLTKPIALLALPFYFIANLRQLLNWRNRIQYAAMTFVGTLLLILVTFLPFGSPLDLVVRLARESYGGAGFSLTALILLINQAAGRLISSLLILQLAQVGLILFLLWAMWLSVNGRSAHKSAQESLAVYILHAANFRLWYATWLFPWSLISQSTTGKLSYQLKVTMWFLITTQLSPMIFGHLRVYALAGSHLWAHLIAIPLIFGLPFYLAKD
jgi:hypothetical protein